MLKINLIENLYSEKTINSKNFAKIIVQPIIKKSAKFFEEKSTEKSDYVFGQTPA